MVSALVSYLIRQGVYKSGEIAVLTPYLGQFKKFQQKLGSSMQIIVNDRDTEDLASLEVDVDNKLSKNKKSPAKISALDGIRAATVDNFQGEEADVVIVSLVRSNKEKKCGFFSVSNRINVLLSRARYGIYIIGNSHTCSNVPIWTQVIEILGHKSNIGRELELQYPKHPETRNLVSQPDHFVQFSPNGGCNVRCDRKLDCGHLCTGSCHSAFLHDTFKCMKDCPRPKKNCTHPCRKRCGEPCGTMCTETICNAGLSLPCGHTIDIVECWRAQDPDAIQCSITVEKLVSGCRHKVKLPCHRDVSSDSYSCRSECGFRQPCGHACKAKCSNCFRKKGGKVVTNHLTTCQQICGRDYNACNHRCEAVCHQGADCLPCPSPCQNQCVHSKCGKICHEPCAPCAKKICSSSCPHSKCNIP
ncbi:hypothetical protein MCOR19_009381 [Pyricularia oryzae]|nr:hypothetical protein MCOR01_006626 [Pyricularia oryzae]KAI6254095.1 hypothetical protein MCOR19_009381 [Pyricularia oryzae]KAI6380523.1 hypothetical protein MCOR32_004026 [Pyricularia oryzae]KAI6447773.1 hypothetical protein MCOR15_010112 [Pyricularia oryzae]KAI6484934.1 hypothetical protein MCOR11_009887 [Pyricularia oryzae]